MFVPADQFVQLFLVVQPVDDGAGPAVQLVKQFLFLDLQVAEGFVGLALGQSVLNQQSSERQTLGLGEVIKKILIHQGSGFQGTVQVF